MLGSLLTSGLGSTVLISSIGDYISGGVKATIESGFIGLMLFLDSIAYKIAAMLYSLFYKLANAKLFTNDMYQTIADRVYIIMGIVALFSVSIALLKALVNPDDVGKTLIKSYKTLITSLILLVLMPTIFETAFYVQSVVFEDKFIENFFTLDMDENAQGKDKYGTDIDEICTFDKNGETLTIMSSDNGDEKNGTYEITKNECSANYMVLTVLEGFFTPTPPQEEGNLNYPDGTVNTYGTKYTDARRYIVGTGDFSYITSFFDQVYDSEVGNEVSYKPVISTLAALFLAYVFLTFCIDLGIRCAKLAFYELISPIPILMRLIPKKEAQFEKWVSQTVGCFLEVFSRVIIISFIMFVAKNFILIIDNIGFGSNAELNLFGKAVILMGLFAFAKQAPKLLQDALGIEGGNINLGFNSFKEKLLGNGGAVAGAAVGAGLTAGVRNTTNAFKNIRNAKGLGKVGAALALPGSVVAGTVSGVVRGGKAGWGKTNFGDVSKAAGSGAAGAVEAREKRANYRAAHSSVLSGVPIVGGILDTVTAAAGHVEDLGSNVGEWAGIDSLDDLKRVQDSIGQVASQRKVVDDRLETIIEKQKNEREATVAVTADGRSYTKLGDLENAFEILKNSAPTPATPGASVPAAAIEAHAKKMTEYSNAIEALKKQQKQDILKGYDKTGTYDPSKMDADLQTEYQKLHTLIKNNSSTIDTHYDKKDGDAVTGMAHLSKEAKDTRNIIDIMTSGDAWEVLDKGKNTIGSAKKQVDMDVNKHLERKQESGK